MTAQHAADLDAGKRFAFGENWSRFLAELDDGRIRLAEQSLRDMLRMDDLNAKRFIDIGSGSGLFSLAARRLGATVHSFDYDPKSVSCTAELRRRYFPDDPAWVVEHGSVLDSAFLKSLGKGDIVYSWGVLHHTGRLQEALGNVSHLVSNGGNLFIAVYNDQRFASRIWLRTKEAYNRLPHGLRWLVLIPGLVVVWGPASVRDLLRGRPFHTWRNYPRVNLRGMSAWRDVVDWVGGLPFEVATPEYIVDFYRARGFNLTRIRTCNGHGCNEYVFRRER